MRGVKRALALRTGEPALSGRICALAVLCVGAMPAVASASSGGLTQVKLAHMSATAAGERAAGAFVAVDPGSDAVAVTGTVGATNETELKGGRVWIVNARTHKLAHTIALTGASVASIADDPATRSFYVADPYLTVPPSTTAGGVAVISAQTGKLTDEIPAPDISGGIGADPKSGLIYATGPGYAITPISAHAKTLGAPIDSGDILYPMDVSIDPATDVGYVAGGASGGTDGVWIVGLASGKLYGVTSARPVSIPTTDTPVGIATDPGTHRTYVALDDSNGSALATIDGTSPRYAATKNLKNGNSTTGVAVDANSHAVYVPNVNETAGCPGFVDELSGRTGKVVAIVHNVTDPLAIAVDPNTGMVYVLDGARLDSFRGGFASKQKKCGTPGTVIGA